MSVSFISYHDQKGFTLIELAMVLFIVGLMLGGLLTPLATKVEYENRNQTIQDMAEIKEVLIGFAMLNGYLPCPDTTDDGVEDTVTLGSGETCASDVGNLPWITLGVTENDAWGNHYNYRVDNEFADRGDSAITDGTSTDTCTSTANISFALCSEGDIKVVDADGSSTIVADNIPAIIVSHGSNASETPTAHEEENYDDSSNPNDDLKTFVKKDYSEDATEGFDDIVVWLSPHLLRNRMVTAGVLP